MGIFKKANNIYITVRDTYTSVSGSSYEEAEDNDFATGLSFEDLEKVATFLSEDKEEVTADNIELLQKVEGTSLLEAIEKALPQATLKVSVLLEKALPKTVESKMEFDIREFV